MGPLGPRRLAPGVRHEARQARARHPDRHLRARARADRRRASTTATRSSRSPRGRCRLLALRSARRARLRVVREQVPGLVRASTARSGRRSATAPIPPSGFLPLNFINMAPPFCWTCQGLVRAPRTTGGTGSSVATATRTRFYCSTECQWMDESNPGRYTGDRNYLDRYHGWEASEVIRDLGFVRADGETLIGQPHLRRRAALDARRHPRPRPHGSSARTSGWRASSGCRPATGGRRATAVPLSVADRVRSMRVRFEPIGEEIECAPEETVLDAAFRQGYNLVYGCREGQCSACKCFLLEGDVALKRYSSFALSDTERVERLLADVPGDARAGPRRRAAALRPRRLPARARDPRSATAAVEAVEPLTARHRAAGPARAGSSSFTPGQYVDLHVPGEPTARGARSRWPTCPATTGSS